MNQLFEKFNLSNYLEDAYSDENEAKSGKAVFFILCLIPIFSIIAYGAVDSWAWFLILILTALIVIFWFAGAWRERGLRFNPSALLLPIAGLVLIGLIQLLPLRSPDIPADLLSVPAISALSLDAYETRFFVIQLIVYFVYFAAALVFINNRARLQKLVLTIIIFGAIMAFFGILQRLANPEAIYGLRVPQQAIFFASYINQHHFAALMNMTLGLTLGVLIGKGANKDKNLLLLIAAFLMVIAVVFTGSRGGMISFFGILAFLLLPKLFAPKTSPKNDEEETILPPKLKIIGGAAAVFVVLIGAIWLLGGDESLTRGIGFGAQEDVSNGRLHFWSAAWKIFLDHPIIGAGFESFGAAFPRYDNWSGIFRVERAHNDYLQTLSDSGIAGFICVISFIYLLFRQGVSIARNSSSSYRQSVANGALAGCFGILIHSFFDFPLRTPANAFVFLLFASMAIVSIHYPKISRKKPQRNNRDSSA